MTIKPSENLLALELNIEKSTDTVSNANKDFVFDKVIFDTEALSDLQLVFDSFCQSNFDSKGFTKTASVKFMITMQDESDLQGLGYSKAQIDKLKPQEAADILQAGTIVEPTNGME
jgi:hypothetical protein